MKKYRLLKLFSALALLGGGALALSQVKKAESVGAASTITIYCTKSLNYLNDAISVHQWGGATPGTTWGDFTPMTKAYDNSMGQPVFKLEIPSDRTGIIFVSWQGSDEKQTFNIESGIADNAAWYLSDFAQDPSDGNKWKMTVGTWNIYPYQINYHGNGSTSGSMASETAYDDVDWGLTANSFVKTGSSFAGWNTKADGTGTSYANCAQVLTGTMSSASSTTLDLYAQWRESYADGEYVIGKFGSCNWDVAHAVLMDSDEEKDPWEFNKSVDFAFGDAFKLAYWTDASSMLTDYIGYSDLDPSCGAYQYFSHDNDGNIVCYARGTYHIYSQMHSYGEGQAYSISIVLSSALNEEHLAAKLMGAGNTPGQCETLFAGMKSMFLSLGETAQNAFIAYGSLEDTEQNAQFLGAYRRYVAWAAALGEKPFEEGKVSASGFYGLMDSRESGNLVVIVAIVSVISVSTLAALIVIKKRRAINK